MLHIAKLLYVALLSFAGASLAAAEPPTLAQLHQCARIMSSDGKRIGFVTDIVHGRDNVPTDLEVIRDSSIVHVDPSTITIGDKRSCTTSLKLTDIIK